MSLYEEKKGSIIQQHFQASKSHYYLRNKDKPESINVPNALKALNYLRDRTSHYSKIEHKIILMLPEKERDKYLTERIPELQTLVDSYVSSLSDSAKQQYLSKGKQKAEDQTRRRQFELYKDQLKNVKKFELHVIEDYLKSQTSPIYHRPMIIIKENIATLVLYRRDLDFISRIFSENENLDDLISKLLAEKISVKIEEIQIASEDITKQRGITTHVLAYTKPTEKRIKELLKKYEKQLEKNDA